MAEWIWGSNQFRVRLHFCILSGGIFSPEPNNCFGKSDEPSISTISKPTGPEAERAQRVHVWISELFSKENQVPVQSVFVSKD